MANEVKCNQCDWQGYESELESIKDGEHDFFKGCPNCKTDGYLIDIDNIKQTNMENTNTNTNVINVEKAIEILQTSKSVEDWNKKRAEIKSIVGEQEWIKSYVRQIDGSGLIVKVLGKW